MVRSRSFPLAVLCLLISVPLLAATHVWTGTADDRFSNPSNWIGGTPAGDAAASISFPSTARLTATNDLNGLTVTSIAFSSAAFSIAGNPITLAANASVIDTSQGANNIACDLILADDVAVSVSGSIYDTKGVTFSGAVSGSGGVTLRGGGHLIYAGARPNTYSGTTRVFFGELQLKKPANVVAVAGDLEVIDSGTLYENGYASIFNDEQIAKTSHVTVGRSSHLGCAATQTLGTLTLFRGAHVQTATQWAGFFSLNGTVIFAGDIDIAGTDQGDVQLNGTFLLQGTRTITATASYGALNDYSGFGQKSGGSGITVIAPANADGTYNTVLNLRQSTYDGPTTIKGGGVSIDAPQSAADVQGGLYAGHCKSLTAEGGTINLHSYLNGVTSDGDVKLSGGVTVTVDLGTVLKMNGALDLGGATLQIGLAASPNYGTVYKVVDNASTTPVAGTFAGLPEGATVADRFKISYAGGDGNDVTLTDVGLVPATISSLTASPLYPQTGTPFDLSAAVSASQTPAGTVTFSVGTTVLGTAPVTNGTAKLTIGASLPRGQYTLTAAYSGDSRVAPATATSTLYVVAVAPTIASIDPATLTAGVKTTIVVRGTNFVDGSTVLTGTTGRPTTFVSPAELRADYTPPASETDYQVEIRVRQPDVYGAQLAGPVTMNVTGVKKPPSPFIFGSDKTATVTGVTPGAMTFWFGLARGGPALYQLDHIVVDADRDGSVTLPFPFVVASLPPFGVWIVADLNARTIVSDNPSHDAPAISPFPPKAFLRDGSGNYTHIEFPANASLPWTFAWARPGIGAWVMLMADSAPIDEDGGANNLATFETTSMQRTIGTTATAPADGLKPGDMFFAIDGQGSAWWADAVDAHLSESDGAGKLGFSAASMSVPENGGSAKVIVLRTEGTDGTVTIQYATADGTAIAGKNYVAQAGTLTFNPGEIIKSIAVPLIDDQTYSGPTQFKVTLSNPAGAAIAAVTTSTVTINDDEKPPVLSIVTPPASVQEGDAGQVDIPIVVKLTGSTSLPVTVNWFWGEGDFGSSHNGQLLFAPGETQKTVTVSYLANTTPEPDRVITMGLGNPTNATAPGGPVKITIVDDDFAGVSIADASVVESAGKVSVPLQLSRGSQKPVTVTYETRNGTAVAGSDYVGTSGTVTVSPGASIVIPIINDSVLEPLKSFEVVLTSVTGGKLDRATAAVIIVDDDTSTTPTPRRRAVHH